MKTKLFMLFTLAIWVFTACEEKIDIAKEEAAIKAVFEADKTAYLNQDATAMAEFWVQDASSQKIFQSTTGENVISGWENINVSQQKEVADTTWDRSLVACTFSDFKINISDESAWVTSKTNWKGTFKGQQADMNQSRIAVMKKVNGNWKFALMAIYNFPMEEVVANSKSPNKLNQAELLKIFLGSWKSEIAKDTFYTAQYKMVGNGIEGSVQIASKGKIIMQGRQMVGYDKRIDKLVETDLVEGTDYQIYGMWFTSENAITEVPYEYISNPDKAPAIWKYEIKSPDSFVWYIIENNKTTGTYTFHREKK